MLLLVHILGIVRKLFNFKDDGECDVAVVVASDEMCQVVSGDQGSTWHCSSYAQVIGHWSHGHLINVITYYADIIMTQVQLTKRGLTFDSGCLAITQSVQ